FHNHALSSRLREDMLLQAGCFMTQKRVDHGPMMNDRQQDRPLGAKLFNFVAREAPKFVSFGLVGVVNALVNYVITVGLTMVVLIPLGLGNSD
ncbi:hypothetical protein, partial [Stenotrophomonas maltophilia]|uniref:hypothetical protein n=1 Tax=Stenotrophomonas maltophilia TaxID=40324 RepID=UPI0013D9AD65